jgi:hypothetical protein
MGQRVLAQLGIRIGADQRAAGVVEIHAAMALGGIIERVAKRREIGDPALSRRASACSRRGAG